MALAVILSRMLQFTAAMILCGSSLFFLYGMSTGIGGDMAVRRAWPRQLLLGAAIAGLAGSVTWLMAETATLTGAAADAFSLPVTWTVAAGTSFGRVASLRLLLFAASVLLLGSGWRHPNLRLWTVQAAVGTMIAASFAWTGHGAGDGALHTGADVLHLLAAAIWIGALVPLAVLVVLSLRPAEQIETQMAHRGLASFSGIGTATVAVLVVTGVVNSWFLVGPDRLGALLTSPYGLLLSFKLVLFAGMLCLAAVNRFLLTPALARGVDLPDRTALRRLRFSVLTETAAALLVLIVVSWLGTLAPPSADGDMGDGAAEAASPGRHVLVASETTRSARAGDCAGRDPR